ncbi:uncharacterized protein [Asterias amurensis]|uniref:uncharacterized protein n=1 Tax=Asterias amurensis TaxID=7602 RepID=UPI003AB5FC4A
MRMRSITVFGVAGIWWLTIVGFVISGIDGQGSRYIGCFYDLSSPPTSRALPDLTSCPDSIFCDNFCTSNIPYCESAGNMSVTNCARLCSRQNKVYAGLQAGRQCFCGLESASYERHGRETDETRCKSNCSGDVTQSCGNDLRMEVYEIGCTPLASLPQNTTVSPSDKNFFKIGENMIISCRDGFLTNRTSLTCLPTGEWSLLPPSCLYDVCASPDPPSGTTARETSLRESSEFYGGNVVIFECLNDIHATVNVTCLEGEWMAVGSCPEAPASTDVMTTIFTEIYTASSPDTTQGKVTTTEDSMTTTYEKVSTTAFPTTVTPQQNVSTSSHSDEYTTLITPDIGPVQTIPNMLWLIIILVAAMCLFLIVLFIAIMVAYKGKHTQNEARRSSNESLHIPKVSDMSQINHAFIETETPTQNGHHQTSGTPPPQEHTYENGAAMHHEYAKPSTPPTTNGRKVVNEYASPVLQDSNGEMAQVPRTKKRVSYSFDMPEQDYDPTRRESYVEMVTKL